MHIGLTQQNEKLEIWRIVRTCHSDKVAHTGVGISIEFRAIYRHPFVGAVIDRPRKRAEFRRKFTSNGTISPKEMRIWKLFLPGAQ